MKRKIFSIILSVIFVSGCGIGVNTDSSQESAFDLLYPNCEMNSSMMFLPLQPNYRNEDIYMVSYRNISQNKIAYYPGDGLKILYYEDDNATWVEVSNNLQYSTSPTPYIIIEEASDNLSGYDTEVFSPLLSENTPDELRVVITGYFYKDDMVTNECVGAFMDFFL